MQIPEQTIKLIKVAFIECNDAQDQVQLQYKKGVITNTERLKKQLEHQETFNDACATLIIPHLLTPS